MSYTAAAKVHFLQTYGLVLGSCAGGLFMILLGLSFPVFIWQRQLGYAPSKRAKSGDKGGGTEKKQKQMDAFREGPARMGNSRPIDVD